MKKLLCLLLAALMTTGAFASCAKNNDTAEETTKAAGSDNTEAVESETKEVLEVPDTRYEGHELTFLTRGQDEEEWTSREIYVEGLDSNSDNIDTAVYERNSMISEKFGVTIMEIQKPAYDHPAVVLREISAMTGDFSAIVSTADVASTMASQGLLWDLNSQNIQYINTDKSWWDTNLAKGVSIDNHLYFATGDIMIADNDATFAIMFNKSLAKDAQLPDLYQLVADQKWTMEQLAALEKQAKVDNDGDGTLAYDTDICGLAYTQDTPCAFMYGAGLSVVTKDEYDQPAYTFDVERGQEAADLCKEIYNKDYSIHMNKVTGVNIVEVGKTCFGGGHALFLTECLQAVTRLRGYDVDFGILPFPKFDEQQESYHSMMHFYGTVVSIPRSVIDSSDNSLTMVDTVLEAMACYSKPTLTEQYYEINLKTKNAKDEQSGPMIDTILANRVFDLAYYFKWGKAADSIAQCFGADGKPIASRNSSIKKACEKQMAHTIKQMDKANGNAD